MLDVTPTVLTLLGQPVADDMDGKPLVQVMDACVRPFGHPWFDRIASWEDVDGPAGMHAANLREDPLAARAAVQQLVDLGYIEQPDKDEKRAASSADREARYNLARAYVDGGLTDRAAETFAELVAEDPGDLRYRLQYAQCLLRQERYAEARGAAIELLDHAEQQRIQRIAAAERQAERIERERDRIIERGEELARQWH